MSSFAWRLRQVERATRSIELDQRSGRLKEFEIWLGSLSDAEFLDLKEAADPAGQLNQQIRERFEAFEASPSEPPPDFYPRRPNEWRRIAWILSADPKLVDLIEGSASRVRPEIERRFNTRIQNALRRT